MCTSLLVGKKASINGMPTISRNEDSHLAINPKRFEIVKASFKENDKHFSINTKLEIDLPSKAYRYSAMPDVISYTYNNGRYSEISVNEVNVVVSSSESLYGNERVLAYDPLVENGIAEDAINDIVAPYINSAKEGVILLGEYIKKYGSAEGNGIIFADEDEIWYMEIPSGHHWVAIKIPDDMYAIAPNCVCIEEVDFNSPDFLYSEGIREFVQKYNLNPGENFNFRDIFGTYSKLDREYNTARAWFTHKYFDKNFNMNPTDDDIPFLNKPDRLITVEDMQYILGSHYNETNFDPMGNGSPLEKSKFRSIGLSRNQESHIVEVGKYTVKWLCLGTVTFSPFVPFFMNIDDVPREYKELSFDLDLNSAYWLFKVLSYYVDNHYDKFSKEHSQYLDKMKSYGRKRVFEIKTQAMNYKNEELTKFLTKENEKTVKYILAETKKILEKFAKEALSFSNLTFTMDKNL